jgi:hypothetical protein
MIITNRYIFVEFGYSFIRNAFSFPIKMKALFINGYLFLEFGFPLPGNDYPFFKIGNRRNTEQHDSCSVHKENMEAIAPPPG